MIIYLRPYPFALKVGCNSTIRIKKFKFIHMIPHIILKEAMIRVNKVHKLHCGWSSSSTCYECHRSFNQQSKTVKDSLAHDSLYTQVLI